MTNRPISMFKLCTICSKNVIINCNFHSKYRIFFKYEKPIFKPGTDDCLVQTKRHLLKFMKAAFRNRLTLFLYTHAKKGGKEEKILFLLHPSSREQ